MSGGIPPFPDDLGGFEGASLNGEVRWLNVEPIEPSFIERPLLQAATFHLVVGRLGIGKGAIIMRWVARCTNGAMYGRPRNVLLLSSEEDDARDLVPRIKVAGGNPLKVAMIPNTFLLPRDIEYLRELVLRAGDVGLVALDPLSNHISGNPNADEEVRNALQPLTILAGELDVPLLGVRHVSSKEGRGGFVARIMGSTAWPAVSRVVLGVGKDGDDVLHVRAVKGNRVPAQQAGRRYHLESAPFLDWQETVVLAIEDGESLVDIDGLLEPQERQVRDSTSEKARFEIIRVLRDAGGDMESSVVDGRVAELTGMAVRSVRDLRMELRDRGLIRHRQVRDGQGIDHWDVVLTDFGVESLSNEELASTSSEEPSATSNPVSRTSFSSSERHRVTPTGVSSDLQGFPSGIGLTSGDSSDLQEIPDIGSPLESPQSPQSPDTPDTPVLPNFWETEEEDKT